MALNFTKLEIMNGIDAHLNITSEVTLPYSVDIPIHYKLGCRYGTQRG